MKEVLPDFLLAFSIWLSRLSSQKVENNSAVSVDLTCSRIYLFLFICSLKCVLSGPPRLALLSAEPGD